MALDARDAPVQVCTDEVVHRGSHQPYKYGQEHLAELPTQVPFAIFERVQGKTHATKQVYEGQGCNNQIEPLKRNKICNSNLFYFDPL